MRTLLTTIAVALLALTACAPKEDASQSSAGNETAAVTAADPQDGYYLELIRTQEPSLAGVPDAKLLQMGHASCDALAESRDAWGELWEEWLFPDPMDPSKGMEGSQAKMIVLGSANAFCPEHTEFVSTVTNLLG